jgi:membrane associated rhomboid family serine protease
MDPFTLLLNAPVNMALLAANIGLSIAAFQNVRLLDSLLFDVNRIKRDKQWYRWVTSAFIHGDPTHLFFNMLALFFFGPAMEVGLGTIEFIAIYFGSLLAGSAWTWMEHYRDPNYRALGASGAISGVTSAAALFFPFSTIYLFFAVPMPMIVFALGYIIWSAVASAGRVRDGIGHAAHLGGALAGVVIVCIWWPQAPQAMIDQLADKLRGF